MATSSWSSPGGIELETITITAKGGKQVVEVNGVQGGACKGLTEGFLKAAVDGGKDSLKNEFYDEPDPLLLRKSR